MTRKEQLFKTAIATIPCAHFREGDHVAVKWYWQDGAGHDWYIVDDAVAYRDDQLTHFVL